MVVVQGKGDARSGQRFGMRLVLERLWVDDLKNEGEDVRLRPDWRSRSKGNLLSLSANLGRMPGSLLQLCAKPDSWTVAIMYGCG